MVLYVPLYVGFTTKPCLIQRMYSLPQKTITVEYYTCKLSNNHAVRVNSNIAQSNFQ